MSADPKDVDFDVLDLLAQRRRDAIIEECAQVAESLAKNQLDTFAQDALIHAAAAIRALKSQDNT